MARKPSSETNEPRNRQNLDVEKKRTYRSAAKRKHIKSQPHTVATVMTNDGVEVQRKISLEKPSFSKTRISSSSFGDQNKSYLYNYVTAHGAPVSLQEAIKLVRKTQESSKDGYTDNNIIKDVITILNLGCAQYGKSAGEFENTVNTVKDYLEEELRNINRLNLAHAIEKSIELNEYLWKTGQLRNEFYRPAENNAGETAPNLEKENDLNLTTDILGLFNKWGPNRVQQAVMELFALSGSEATNPVASSKEKPPLPEQARITYAERGNDPKLAGLNIIEFLRAEYGPWLDGTLTRPALRLLDFSAYMALSNYLRNRELPDDVKIPLKKEVTDKLAEMYPDPATRPANLDSALRNRARRAIAEKPSSR